jgi:hypothetical protein
MSERSSAGRARGRSAMAMLIRGIRISAAENQLLYCFSSGLNLVVRGG